MREQQCAASSTIRRRMAALSSLFKHLVRHGSAGRNPVVDVQRPSTNREEGSTAAFSKAQARRLLDAPAADTVVLVYRQLAGAHLSTREPGRPVVLVLAPVSSIKISFAGFT